MQNVTKFYRTSKAPVRLPKSIGWMAFTHSCKARMAGAIRGTPTGALGFERIRSYQLPGSTVGNLPPRLRLQQLFTAGFLLHDQCSLNKKGAPIFWASVRRGHGLPIPLYGA